MVSLSGTFVHKNLKKPAYLGTSALRRKYLHITALRLIYLSSAFWRNYMAIREMGNNFRHDALEAAGRDRRPGIHHPHPEIVLAHDPPRHRHPLELGMGQQCVVRRIEHRPKGRVLGLSSEGPAVARLCIDHANVVQRKRRLVPAIDDDLLARIVLPIRLQVGLLRLRQRPNSRRHAVDPTISVERLRGHPRVPLVFSSDGIRSQR